MTGQEALDFLANLRNGVSMHEIAEAIVAVGEGVRTTGKAGRVVLTIDVRPVSKTSSGQVMVADSVKATVPKSSPAEVLMFVSEGGALSRRDPRQPVLPGVVDD